MGKTFFIIIFLFMFSSFSFSNYCIGTKEQYEIEHLKYQRQTGWTEEQILNGKPSTDIYGNILPKAIRTTKAFDIQYKSQVKDECIWYDYTGKTDLAISKESLETKCVEWGYST